MLDEFRFYRQWMPVMELSGMNAASLSWVIKNTNITDSFNPDPVVFFFESMCIDSGVANEP